MSDEISNTIRDIIVKRELIAKDVLKKAENEASGDKVSLVEVLVKRNYLDAKVILTIVKEQLSIETCDIMNVAISHDTLALIPEPIIKKYKILPFSVNDDIVNIATQNPLDVLMLDDIQMLAGCKIEPYFSFEYQIVDRIESLNEKPSEEKNAVAEMDAIINEAEDNLEVVDEQQDAGEDIFKGVNETPIIRITNKLLLEAIRRGASDIFIEPWEKTMRIRCRVDGLLEEVKAPPKSMANSIVSRVKVMSELDIAERRLPQDGRFKIKYQNREVDFRVSILPTSFGEKVCLRVLDKTSQSQNIEKLGFHPDELARIQKCADRPHGMLLVTGPTGSGKTSTLYSILNYLDSPDINITTVEDPVEYMMYGVNQVNCKEGVGLTFSAALRSILRQDPDVVMIGEIRDFETMDIAIKAALTGHLVLSTLHTNDACSSITRMINMNIEPFLISSSVLMISAQRLIRRLCAECKKPDEHAVQTIDRYNITRLTDKLNVCRPVGCPSCRETGYSGRIVITEVLVLSEKVKEAVMRSASASEIKQIARGEGMTTLRESGLRKVAEGITSIEEVLRVTASDAN